MKHKTLTLTSGKDTILDYSFDNFKEIEYLQDWYEIFIINSDKMTEIYLDFLLEGWLNETRNRNK